ncbi:SurA N-terminal domain-containing protein [Gammaproteobacteria bacterium]|nr:SurA N-terminal domain-containing protein [Gammaproteobacteria bacterium]
MLISSIKKKSTGFVAYFIVGLIALTFIVTALYGIDFMGSGQTVAKVGDKEISKTEFLKNFVPQQRNLQQQLGAEYSPDIENILKQTVIDQMVNSQILFQYAQNHGYVTTPKEVQTNIAKNEVFYRDGKFDVDQYKKILRLNGYSVQEYEASQFQQLTQEQLRSNIEKSAFVTDFERKNVTSLLNQERKFDYLEIPVKDFSDQVSITDSMLKDYFDKNQDRFIKPMKVSVDFVELNLDEVTKSISPSDDDLAILYDEEKNRFSTDEERKAQHILVENKVTADQVISLINEGKSFDDLAKEYSIDTGSKNSGGDLGFFGIGVMVPEFETAVFAMKEGEVSGPIKSEFGFHVIKLNKIKESSLKSFDEVKEQLVKIYQKNQGQKMIYDLSDEMTNLAYEGSLEELAEKMNLKLQTSKLFSKTSKSPNKKMINAAFSDPVLNRGENSEPIDLGDDKLVVLRLNNLEKSRNLNFDEVKIQVEGIVKTQESKKLADKLTDEIITLISDNQKTDEILKKNNLKWTSVEWTKRDNQKVDPSAIDLAFKAPKPNSKPGISLSKNLGSKNMIVRVNALKTSDESAGNVDRLLNTYETDEFYLATLKELKKEANIEIYRDRL